MKKLFLFSITLLLLYPLALTLPVQAESSENVTKRRPDRATNYSPASSPVGVDPRVDPNISVQPEVKQVQTNQSSFFSDLWGRIQTFFTQLFQQPSASSTTTATP